MKTNIKENAVSKLNSLFKSGGISNKEFICAICGKQPIHKHHGDYGLWYCFIPLCIKHHHLMGKDGWGIGYNRPLSYYKNLE